MGHARGTEAKADPERSEGREVHMMVGAGAGMIVLVLVVLLILILTAAVPLTAAQFGGLAPALAVGMLLLAIVVGAGVGALLAGWPTRLALPRKRGTGVHPEQLRDPVLRRQFERMLEYRRGIAETRGAARGTQPRALLREVMTASGEPLLALFKLARAVDDGRQSALLRGDLARLRGKTEPLTTVEREQLASLERLDEMARVGGGLIAETEAVLGRCYAQSRELVLARSLAEGDVLYLTNELRDQAALLGHVAATLRDLQSDRP